MEGGTPCLHITHPGTRFQTLVEAPAWEGVPGWETDVRWRLPGCGMRR